MTACLHAANQLTAESGEDVSLPVDVDKYVIPAFSTSRDTAGGVEQRSDVDIEECERPAVTKVDTYIFCD